MKSKYQIGRQKLNMHPKLSLEYFLMIFLISGEVCLNWEIRLISL